MGKVGSKILRPLKNFNVENRAQRVLESEKPRPAPRYPSTAAPLENIALEHPEHLQEQKTKHEKLDEFLKSVKVDSVGFNTEIRSKSERSMPENRSRTDAAEYGFPDPEEIPENRASLRQALHFISQHRLDPKNNSASKIAVDYSLDPVQVQHVLTHFQALHLHIPKDMLDKNPKMLSGLKSDAATQQSVSGMDNILKVGRGVSTDDAKDPKLKN